MAGEALVVENLVKYFPPALSGWRALVQPFTHLTERALDGVSFSVAQGEILALVGANGAGKSTLLRVLATLLVPTRGHARVAGHDVERESAAVRRCIGFHTGSDAAFYSRLTGRENLEFFAALNNLSGRETSARIAKLSDLLGLAASLEKQVRTLSTGTVHRLGLARALLHQPEVLLLDEPTRSLDPLTAAEFRRFLKNELVRQRGTTLIFASHAPSEIEQVGERMALLHEGRILACDAPRRVLEHTASQSLEEAMEKLTGRAPLVESQ
ncbi:MAG: ABC transporter ATP-binding protein [Verrucomicrobiales bacterium]|nr:ABC transporter ATP-binding protein [Verrucomicrobiales bacterium]